MTYLTKNNTHNGENCKQLGFGKLKKKTIMYVCRWGLLLIEFHKPIAISFGPILSKVVR